MAKYIIELVRNIRVFLELLPSAKWYDGSGFWFDDFDGNGSPMTVGDYIKHEILPY